MNTFEVTAKVTYRPERIPPRCRKPRRVDEVFEMTMEIPVLQGAQAPVACAFHADEFLPNGVQHPKEGLRFYGDRFYTRTDATPGGDGFPAVRYIDTYTGDRREAEREAVAKFEDRIIVDGFVWKAIGEPYYSVVGYGLGNNHGGSGLHLNFMYGSKLMTSHDFAATELEAAIEGAVDFARGRGDDQSVNRLREFKGVKVLLPEAFKIVPQSLRAASKEAEARVIADRAAEMLSGDLTRESLREIEDMLKGIRDMMWHHDIDVIGN